MTPLLRNGHQLEHMAVRIAKIKTAAAAPIVELAVIEAPRRATKHNIGLLDAPQDGVELAIGDVKSQMMGVEIRIVVEQQSQLFVYSDRREMPGAAALCAENLSEEFRRGGFVARRNDGVIERNGHGGSSRRFRYAIPPTNALERDEIC